MGFLVWFCVEAAAFGQSAPEALSDLLVRRARMFAAIPLATSSDLELAHQLPSGPQSWFQPMPRHGGCGWTLPVWMRTKRMPNGVCGG